MQSNCSPPPVARAVAMLMSLSGRDHGHISRMMRRLRQQVGAVGAIAADPNPPAQLPSEPEPAPKESPSGVSDLERDIVFQQLIQEEEETRRRQSAASSVTSSSAKKKKKGKRNHPQQKKPSACEKQSDSEPAEPNEEEDLDDDACIYQRLGLERATSAGAPPQQPLPFGPPAKKRTHKKRKPIRPLTPVLEPTPAEPERAEPEPTEPTPAGPERAEPEPTKSTPAEPEPTEPEPTKSTPAEPEPTEPERAEPEPKGVVRLDGPSVEDPAWVDVPEPRVFSRVHEWARPIESGRMPLYADRSVTHFMDVLRWTPLVYVHSARRSFEKQAGVQHVF